MGIGDTRSFSELLTTQRRTRAREGPFLCLRMLQAVRWGWAACKAAQERGAPGEISLTRAGKTSCRWSSKAAPRDSSAFSAPLTCRHELHTGTESTGSAICCGQFDSQFVRSCPGSWSGKICGLAGNYYDKRQLSWGL